MPTFTAIIHPAVLPCQLVWAEIPDKYIGLIANALLDYNPSQIGTFHHFNSVLLNCPFSPRSHRRPFVYWAILQKANTASFFQAKHCTSTMPLITCVHIVRQYTTVDSHSKVNAPCDLIPLRMWLFGCSIGHLALIHTTLKALKSSCRQDRHNTWPVCVCMCVWCRNLPVLHYNKHSQASHIV